MKMAQVYVIPRLRSGAKDEKKMTKNTKEYKQLYTEQKARENKECCLKKNGEGPLNNEMQCKHETSKPHKNNEKRKQRNRNRRRGNKILNIDQQTCTQKASERLYQDSWQSNERSCLLKLLKSNRKEFFVFPLERKIIVDSLARNSVLPASDSILSLLLKSPNVLKCLLLTDKQKKLIGIATINEPIRIGCGLCVEYQCLSYSNINVNEYDCTNRDSIKSLILNYIKVLEDDDIQEYVPNRNKLLNANRGVVENKPDYSSGDVENKEERLPSNYPVKNMLKLKHFDARTNFASWQFLEYYNVEEIAESLATVAFCVYDTTVTQIHHALTNEGRFEFAVRLKSKTESSYLLLREASAGDVKHVLGIAQLVENNTAAKFVCLSRAKYVTTPWNDDNEFTHGQWITHREEIRTVLDEYRTSICRKALQPILPQCNPWNEKPFILLPSGQHSNINGISPDFPTLLNKKQCVPNQTTNFSVNEHVVGKVSAVSMGMPGKPHVQNCQQVKGRELLACRTSEKSLYRVQTSAEPIKNRSSHYHKNTPRVCNILPPIMGLFTNNKNLSERPWWEIECSNLSAIKSPNSDFFLCDTTLGAIRDSFHTNRLQISKRNMENLLESSCARKYLLLRASQSRSQASQISGVANVDMSSCIVKGNRDGYLATVCYVSLSMPLISVNTLTNADVDGIELNCALVNTFLQRYKFQLQQGKTLPLFHDVYPWCPVQPACLRKKIHKATAHNAANVRIVESVDVNIELRPEDTLDYYLNNGTNYQTSFELIYRELDAIRDATCSNSAQPPESAFRPPNCNMEKLCISKNPISNRGRQPLSHISGRGRGTLLAAQVKQINKHFHS